MILKGGSLEIAAPAWRAIDFIEVTREAEGVRLKLDRCLQTSAVLRARTSELRHVLMCTLRRMGLRPKLGRIPSEVWAGNDHRTDTVIIEIACSIDEVASRPCTPRHLKEILGIRGSERVRWTKDGRLRTAGVTSIRGGQGLTCPVYQSKQIAALAAYPEVIEAWRKQDTAEIYSSPICARGSPSSSAAQR